MNATSGNKRGWRILRRLLLTVAILATLLAALYAEEDWRGKRAWENYKREWEAKGEKFDWRAFVPPSVPDDQNFFTAPIFTNMLNGKIVMSPYGNDGGPDIRPDASRSSYAIYRVRMTDLQAWQNYYRNPTNIHAVNEVVTTHGVMLVQTNYLNHATDEFPIAPEPQTPAKDVLFALSKFDSAVEELRQASQRPYANVPLNYEDGFNSASSLLPVLAELKRCTQLLQMRAVAELADGQSSKALDDVKLLLYLNDSLRSSPFLISPLVRFAIVSYDLQPIWEGLAEHKWSDEQLVALDDELGKLDFLADYGFIMRGERAFAIKSFENQRRAREMISYTDTGDVTNKLTFMPNAYFYQNELAIARMQQQWILPLVDTNSRIISPAALQRANDAVRAEKEHYHFPAYTAQAMMLFPAISATVRKLAAIQSGVDLARVACALERYRLAHGEYPETLDQLSPQFIAKVPHDIINGEPLHYHRTDGGQFVLYSVGWNETDDGGQVVLAKNGSVDRENGDWVWQYPAK
jgi:tetratricopeptide (TPR) repeat protein